MPDKPLIWLGSSRRALRAFPALARRLAGFQLRRVQQGLDPDDWKPMQTVGAGVREIRIHIGGAHRVFYVATRAEAIYVLHALEKKTQKTNSRDLEIGRDRFRALERLGSTMAKKSAVRVTPSTGNVFRDLGFSKEESEHLLVRADLLIQVQKAIASRRLKQAEAAKVLRVTQPRVSDLLRGRIDLFSTDALIDMLARLGVGVRLVVKTPRSKKVA
jgi:phage-related protein/predicted XRE-type DNA-binding protein